MTGKSEKSLIQKFVGQCRTAGLKVTPQRLLVYRALLLDDTHPNPDRLYRKIKRSHPTISHATVYKTLESFEMHGIIARLTPLHETVRYDPIVEPHHHVVCVRCKRVTNLHDPDFDSLAVPEHVRRGSTILGLSVYINVICPACRRSTAGS